MYNECESALLWSIVACVLIGLGIMIGAGIRHGVDNENAVRAGHAEYYINTNNFNKEWRWKEIK